MAALPFIALGAAGLSAVAGLKSGQATAGGLRSQANANADAGQG
jgi:hypothetical protein